MPLDLQRKNLKPVVLAKGAGYYVGTILWCVFALMILDDVLEMVHVPTEYRHWNPGYWVNYGCRSFFEWIFY